MRPWPPTPRKCEYPTYSLACRLEVYCRLFWFWSVCIICLIKYQECGIAASSNINYLRIGRHTNVEPIRSQNWTERTELSSLNIQGKNHVHEGPEDTYAPWYIVQRWGTRAPPTPHCLGNPYLSINQIDRTDRRYVDCLQNYIPEYTI